MKSQGKSMCNRLIKNQQSERPDTAKAGRASTPTPHRFAALARPRATPPGGHRAPVSLPPSPTPCSRFKAPRAGTRARLGVRPNGVGGIALPDALAKGRDGLTGRVRT